jgi:hypothetical protein
MQTYATIIGREMYINGVYVTAPVYNSGDNTEDKIKSFAQLPQGWDFGHGGPIPEKTLRAARAWNTFLKESGFGDVDAFPGGGKEVVVVGSLGDHYVEVIIENDGAVSVAVDYKHKQESYYPNLSVNDAAQVVRELVRGLWSASVCFTQISIIPNNTNLLEVHSGTSTAGFQLWSGTASSGPATPLRTTSGNIINAIPALSENLQYSGNLIPTPFLPGMWSNKSRQIREMSATMT